MGKTSNRGFTAKKATLVLRQNIARNLRELRELHDESQAKAAKRIGTSPGMVSLLERAGRDPTLHLLTRIAKAYETTVVQLLRTYDIEKASEARQ